MDQIFKIAKFHQHRSNSCCDIAIFFLFLKMAAVSHLKFCGGALWYNLKRVLEGFYHYAKFG